MKKKLLKEIFEFIAGICIIETAFFAMSLGIIEIIGITPETQNTVAGIIIIVISIISIAGLFYWQYNDIKGNNFKEKMRFLFGTKQTKTG